MGEEGNENADRLANQGCWLAETPERDWAALEQEVLDSAYWDDDAEAVQPIVIDDDPEPPVQDATESAVLVEEMEWEPTPPAPPPAPTPVNLSQKVRFSNLNNCNEPTSGRSGPNTHLHPLRFRFYHFLYRHRHSTRCANLREIAL